MRALIIDDDTDLRTIAAMSLRLVGGMDVMTAASGREGIELARLHRPEVILLDVMMPEMDGKATLARLRDMEETRDILTIFLTAKARQTELGELSALHVAAVFTKPFDPLTLANRVKQVVAQATG